LVAPEAGAKLELLFNKAASKLDFCSKLQGILYRSKLECLPLSVTFTLV
jgi:hypothetical protein